MLNAALLILGLSALVGGAELLVRGASRLAAALGLSPLIIGLTVVAFGTSAPELMVSVRAALQGAQADIALGNVVGSNVFNVLGVLGASALVAPLVVAQRMVRLDVPIMIGLSLLTIALALDGRIGRADGALLVALGVAYTLLTVRLGRRESQAVAAEYEREFGAPDHGKSTLLRDGLLMLAGLGLLVLGADFLVRSASEIARALGVGELTIGLTIVAVGTSLPEAATSVMASLRGERDIAVGNVVGSNIFNLLFVLGTSALVGSEGVAVAATALRFDLVVMTVVAVACLPVFFSGHRISRGEGALFLVYYVGYVAYLLLASGGTGAEKSLGAVILWFAAPLTVITLAIGVARQMRRA